MLKAQNKLTVSILTNGDLVVSAWDHGSTVKKLTGDWDQEYFLTVAAEDKESVLKIIKKKNFFSIFDLKTWLEENNIKYKFVIF